jgi:hypothetical protein
MFRLLLDRAAVKPEAWRTSGASVLRFETQRFVEAAAGGGGEMVELYRTGPLHRAESLTHADMVAALARSADYLARTPNEAQEVRDGYDPLRSRWEHPGYDPGRQSLVAAAMVRLHRSAGQTWALRAARTLMQMVVAGLEQRDLAVGDRQVTCAWAPAAKAARLMDAAQVALALCELQKVAPDAARRETIRRLANTLSVAQKPDGSYDVYFVPGTEAALLARQQAEDIRGASLCLLALVRSFEATGDDRLLTAARQAAEYLAYRREAKLGRAQPAGLADPYMIEAVAALDEHLVNDGLVRYAVACAEATRQRQVTDPTMHLADELGGFLSTALFPDAEYTTFCLRGLAALERLAARIERDAPERYRRLPLAAVREPARESARAAEAFLLGLQYTSETSFYVPEAALAVGGLRQSATDPRISTVAGANLIHAEME